MLKSVLKHPVTSWILVKLASLYIRLLIRSSNIHWHIDEQAIPYWKEGRNPAIYAFWHGNLLMMPLLKPYGLQTHAMISTHKDGVLISRVIRYFGLHTLSGSTNRGGTQALKHAIRLLRSERANVVLTPDGPRGPRYSVAPGVVAASRLAEAPIIGFSLRVKHYKQLRSWDRFIIPYPFNTVHAYVSTPLMPAQLETDTQAACAQVKALLMQHETRETLATTPYTIV